jgi:beta-lactamase regulating signal transducer with metallopeptidase domain
MREQIALASRYIETHLLYASIVWVAAWILTSFRGGSATTKYWIWVATSLNFIFPLSPILDAFRVARPFGISTPDGIGGAGNVSSRNGRAIAALSVVWLLGAVVMSLRLWIRIRADRRHAEAKAVENALASSPSFLAQGIPVRFEGSRDAPGVDGVLRPQISLPDGIGRLLSGPELDAVLTHELTHARRGDNLIRLIHEVGLCALWFHPLVWITGSRLALYRELSCDESVIRRARGGDLVSALAKLANAGDARFLRATASSFLTTRLARLTAVEPRRRRLASNAFLTALFGLVLMAGILATAAQTAGTSRFAVFANAPCPSDRLGADAPSSGVSKSVVGGTAGGIKAGIRGGLSGGVRGPVPGGVSGGPKGGVRGGVRNGTSDGVD